MTAIRKIKRKKDDHRKRVSGIVIILNKCQHIQDRKR